MSKTSRVHSMHTKTSKQVLSPLADAVSALIVIISESEVNDTATPDLSQLAKAVDTQIQNLVVVAKKIAAQPSSDVKLQKEMPVACQDVISSSMTLLNASGDLKESPKDSKARGELLEGVKGILQGTTKILDVFDESEIAKILKANQVLRQLLDLVTNHSLESADFVHLLKRVSHAIFQTCQFAQSRVKDLVSDRLAQELQNAVQSIVKESSNYLTCCSLFVTLNCQESKNALIANQALISSESVKIDKIITCKNPDDYFTSINRTKEISKYQLVKNEILQNPLGEQWATSASDTRNLVQQFIGESKKELDGNHKKLIGISNEQVLEYPLQIETTAKQFQSQLNDLVEEMTLSFNEPKLNQDSKELVLGIDQCLAALDYNAQRGLLAELITVLGDLSDTTMLETTVGVLNDGMNKTNPILVGTSLARFNDQTSKLNTLMDRVMDQIPSTYGNYGIISSLQEKAKLVAPQVSSNCSLFQKFPNEQELTDHAQTVLQSYTDIARGLSKHITSYDAVFTTPELLQGAELAIQQHTKALQEALVKNDAQEASRLLGLVNAVTSHFQSIVEKEKENTEDAQFKSGLEREIVLLQGCVPKVVSKCTDMVNHIGHNSSQDTTELNDIITKLGLSLSGVGRVIQNYKGFKSGILDIPQVHLTPIIPVKEPEPVQDTSKITEQETLKLVQNQEKVLDDQLRSLATAIKEMVIVNEEQPKVLTEIEAQQDPIKAAGQELKVEASLWASQENPVVQIVNSIAQKFLDLSKHHKELSQSLQPASKKSFIQTAQEIAAETANLIAALQPLVVNCADKRLVLQIQQTSSRIQTLGQTLKILAAVKASSPRDRDKAVQLISNGQNLVASVKMVLRDAISCSLRLKKGAPSDLFRFRKVVYRP